MHFTTHRRCQAAFRPKPCIPTANQISCGAATFADVYKMLPYPCEDEFVRPYVELSRFACATDMQGICILGCAGAGQLRYLTSGARRTVCAPMSSVVKHCGGGGISSKRLMSPQHANTCAHTIFNT